MTTGMFKDINAGTGSSDVFYMLPVFDRVTLFTANDGLHGNELWVTDGTAGNTNLLTDIDPGTAGSAPEFIGGSETTELFTADDGVHGREIWVTDGTADGTHLFMDINPGAGSSDASVMLVGPLSTTLFTAN